jgi:hypothetical protein
VKIPDGMQVVFQGKADYLREIAQQLAAASIRTATGPLPGSWDARAWLAVASADVQRALAVHQQHLDAMVAREGLRATDRAADFDAEETSCPACGTRFATAGVTRCPDCGLNFG